MRVRAAACDACLTFSDQFRDASDTLIDRLQNDLEAARLYEEISFVHAAGYERARLCFNPHICRET